MGVKRRILIAHDDKNTVALVRRLLEKDGFRVFAARSAPEAPGLIRRGRPDVLVVEQSWLEIGGLDLGSVLPGHTPVIIFTAEVVDEEMDDDTESEVSDRIVKPVDPCEVLSQVRTALRRVDKAAEEPGETRCAGIVIDRRAHEVQVRGEVVHLTPTEFKLLEVLVADSGRAYARSELLGRVFGNDYEGMERTVDTHVKNLRKKIEPDPRDPTYVKTVYGIGYKVAEP